MSYRESRERYLIKFGKYNEIKNVFIRSGNRISDKYIMLIADYFDSLEHFTSGGEFYLDTKKIIKELPQLLKSVEEGRLNVYGRTENNKIIMNSTNGYEVNKLFFFHELTHAIQTRMINNHEECGLFNGDTGMFLTEGATQFIAEILYNESNMTNLHYRNQPNSVRGLSNHVPYSALSQYQLNGNIIMLMSYSLGIPLNQILSLGFRSDGRDLLKWVYEGFPGNEGKFEDFMFDLEKIYSIDKILLAGDAHKMYERNPSNILMDTNNGRIVFKGNIYIENELIDKVERELAANFIANNDNEYIIANYKKFAMYLTTPELKRDFTNAVNQIIAMSSENVR